MDGYYPLLLELLVICEESLVNFVNCGGCDEIRWPAGMVHVTVDPPVWLDDLGSYYHSGQLGARKRLSL